MDVAGVGLTAGVLDVAEPLPPAVSAGAAGSPTLATTVAFASPPVSKRRCWPMRSFSGDGYVYIAPVAKSTSVAIDPPGMKACAIALSPCETTVPRAIYAEQLARASE